MAGNTFLYFGYGSNLLRERLILANPSAVFKTIGKLSDHRLVFVGQSPVWKGGIANIVGQEGCEVWGTVWQMHTKDLQSLDKQEYLHTPIDVDVTAPGGQRMKCRTFQIHVEGWSDPQPPSPQYKDVIVRGARQSQLPADYLQGLESIQDNGYQGDVPVYDEVKKLL